MNAQLILLLIWSFISGCQSPYCYACFYDLGYFYNLRCLKGIGLTANDLATCRSGRCLARATYSQDSLENNHYSLLRGCANFGKVGCRQYNINGAIEKSCICQGDGCNGASFVQINALFWSYIGLVTIFNKIATMLIDDH